MSPTDAGALFRALFDSTPDAIVVVDGAGQVVLANAACEALLGWALDALRGRGVDTLVPARFGAHAQLRAGFAADPQARPMGRGLELFAQHREGHELPVDISLSSFEVGGRRLVACALRDLRGRPHGAENLRVQATALRSAANGIVITTRDGTISWVNPAACAITGYAASELVGQHTRLLKSGRHDAAFYAALWATVGRGETWTGTIVNRRKDGSLYDEQQSIAPVLDERGVATHFIAIKQDVTAQRRDQAELARAHGALEAQLVEIEALNRELQELALRDPLTGLLNRRYLQESLPRDAARAARTGEPLALVALDVDHFKQVNDQHGHATGDRLLKAFAEVLTRHVRASDLVCRVGGEEFLVVMPSASAPAAMMRAEQWRAACAAVRVANAQGLEVSSTISLGVTLVRVGEAVEAALERVDRALYAAKRSGRDRVVVEG